MAQDDQAASQRRLSNVGHWAEGALFAIMGVVALLEALGKLGGAARYLPAAPLVLAGIVIPAILFGHSHGAASHQREMMKDPQQRQHLAMAALILVSGLAELGLRAAWLPFTPFAYTWPAALVVIGVMFMLHTQHGSHQAMAKAVRFHRLLGAVIALAGVARAVQIATKEPRGGFAFASAALLFVVAGLLVTYREPEDAYDAPGDHRAHQG